MIDYDKNSLTRYKFYEIFYDLPHIQYKYKCSLLYKHITWRFMAIAKYVKIERHVFNEEHENMKLKNNNNNML